MDLPIIEPTPLEERMAGAAEVLEPLEGPEVESSQGTRRWPHWTRVLGRAPRFLTAMIVNARRGDAGPHSLTHTTTFKCNYHCKEICDSPLVHQVMQQQPNGKDLTTDEVEKIYQQLPQMDYVRFTGGEPTLRRDAVKLTHLAEQYLKPIVMHLTTNASLPDRVVQFAEQRPRNVPLDLMISIDGVGEQHCRSRHNDKAYQRCMETLEQLAPRQLELRMTIRINQTIVGGQGISEYRKLHAALKPYDVRHQVVLAYDASATYALQRNRSYAPTANELFTPVGEITTQEMDDLYRIVMDDVRQELTGPERWIQQYYMDGIRNRLNQKVAAPNPACVALASHLRIFPNGDVPTCQFNSQTIGNLRLQSFAEVWQGESRKRQRAWVRNCVGCWAGCEVQPSAAYTGDLLRHQWRPNKGDAVSVSPSEA